MWYVAIMKEHWVEEAAIDASVVMILTLLMLSLVAPVLGPWIRARKVREYAMEADWERRVKAEMPWTYAGLTLWAIVAWIVLIYLY
jgi:ABC-type Fe3+ transport system permease subunit